MAYYTAKTLVVLMLASAAVRFGVSTTCPYEECSCSWRNVDCSSRNLERIPQLVNGTFSKLLWLTISRNNISSITPDDLPPELSKFTSTHNPLNHIDTDVFNASTSTLNYVKVTNSPNLTHIPDFSHLTHLQYLHLESNGLVNSASDALPPNLIDLVLDSNNLTYIPHQVHRLTQLHTLIVSSNNISSIDSVVFPPSLKYMYVDRNRIESLSSPLTFTANATSQLATLSLNFNPIKHIADDAFVSLTNLARLQIHDTQLARLPLALTSLTQLHTLDVRNAPGLTCTCVEAEVATWYNNMTSLTIYGDCNNVKVTYFLSDLAPSC